MKIFAAFLTATAVVMSMSNSSASEIKRLNPKGVVNSSQWGFSQAVVAPAEGHYIFVSGQFSGNEQGEIVGSTKEEQIRQTYQNIKTVIEGAGGRVENVVQIRMLINDFSHSDVDLVVKASKALFGENQPASTLIPVPSLAIPGMLFELEATVFVPAK
jgi:enamine deaminase RidA (YjgF/YER057c/UK114 family)